MSPTNIFFAAVTLSLFLAAQALGQCEIQRVVPPPQETEGRFGYQVRMNERHLVVGDFQGDSACAGICSTGVVYAYGRDPDTGAWRQNQIIAPPDIGLGGAFGFSVHLDGDRMIVGATHADIAGGDTGGAYIYEFVGDQWVMTAQFGSPEPHFQSGFGRNVHLHGDVALVMQYTQDVFVYEKTGAGWVLRTTLIPPDEPGGSPFGDSIGLTDDWLLLGAHYDRAAGVNAGSVYVYRRGALTDFEFQYKLYPPDPETRPLFGSSIAVSNDTLIISGPSASGPVDGQGAVYCYELHGEEWVFQQRLTHQPSGRNNFFGARVVLDGDRLLTGAYLEATTMGAGAAYLFQRDDTGEWTHRHRLLPTIPSYQFGLAPALHGDSIAIGAPSEAIDGRRIGAVYAFDLSCFDCPADVDGDGLLTVFDFLTYLNLFQDGDAQADFDGDGELTIFDFLAFQTAFEAGCE